MENLCEHIARRAAESPAARAISRRRPGGAFVESSYADLSARAGWWAERLGATTAPGAAVPLLCAKSADSIACLLGAHAAGRPFCWVNPKYRGPQIAAALDALEPSHAVVDATGLLALRGGLDEFPRLRACTWLVLDTDPIVGPAAAALAALRAAAEVAIVTVAASGASMPPRSGARADVPAACLFTSGSTGTPKGVVVGEADLAARVAAEIEWFGLRRGDVLLSLLPFSFDVGLNQLLTALAVGAELVLLDSWLPADIAATVRARGVSGISAVPAIWQDVIEAGVRIGGGALRYVTISGGSLSRRHLEALPAAVSGAGIFKTYGQTEAFRATSLRPEEFAEHPDSVGRAFPGVGLYVVRDDGTRCAPGEAGEVVHTGLGVMLGYVAGAGRLDRGTKLRPNPFHGAEDTAPMAVFTGDVGVLDRDGYLHLKGRGDGMLKVMGNRVYPLEVAAQLLAVPGVRDAVVTGAGGGLVAFVMLVPDAALSPSALRKALIARLPSYMVPKDLVIVPQIPRTANGKPDAPRLLSEYAAEMAPAR